MNRTKDGSIALHRRIRSDIARKILSNEWMPGFRIPYEHELMQQYGCSRMTVNKALSSLAAGGYLERKRRAGTLVSYPSGHSVSMRIPDIRTAVIEKGLEYKFRLISRIVRDIGPHDNEALLAARPSEVLELETLHLADARPFAWEQRQIVLSAIPEAREVDFAATPPGTWMLQHVPWNNAEHRIRTIAATGNVAELLGVPVGTPCLELQRETWNAGGPLIHAVQIFPNDSLSLVGRFVVNE